jgi:hypothetical protein
MSNLYKCTYSATGVALAWMAPDVRRKKKVRLCNIIADQVNVKSTTLKSSR